MLIKEIAYTMAASLALAVSLAVAPALSKDKAPMPQTRGMQGMDPALHDQAANEPAGAAMGRAAPDERP